MLFNLINLFNFNMSCFKGGEIYKIRSEKCKILIYNLIKLIKLGEIVVCKEYIERYMRSV